MLFSNQKHSFFIFFLYSKTIESKYLSKQTIFFFIILPVQYLYRPLLILGAFHILLYFYIDCYKTDKEGFVFVLLYVS